MTAISCPYCGTTLNLPLKFCLSCGRPVSSSDQKRLGGLKSSMKAGVTKRLDEGMSHTNFDLSKKSYRVHRNLRDVAITLSSIFALLLFYYVSVNVVLNKPLPGNLQQVIRGWLGMTAEPEAAPAPEVLPGGALPEGADSAAPAAAGATGAPPSPPADKPAARSRGKGKAKGKSGLRRQNSAR